MADNRTLAHLEQEIVQMHKVTKAADAADDARHGKESRGDALGTGVEAGQAGGRGAAERQEETRP